MHKIELWGTIFKNFVEFYSEREPWACSGVVPPVWPALEGGVFTGESVIWYVSLCVVSSYVSAEDVDGPGNQYRNVWKEACRAISHDVCFSGSLEVYYFFDFYMCELPIAPKFAVLFFSVRGFQICSSPVHSQTFRQFAWTIEKSNSCGCRYLLPIKQLTVS